MLKKNTKAGINEWMEGISVLIAETARYHTGKGLLDCAILTLDILV